MNVTARSARKAGWYVGIALVLLAGCSGDIAGELSRNVNVRDRVMGAIAADSALAVEMAHRLLGSDRQRLRVVETVLADDRAAQYVLARIGRNPGAVEYVLQVAAADSAGREHIMALLERMHVALKSPKKK